jgi:GNAT superfamily N-acetyltransferase
MTPIRPATLGDVAVIAGLTGQLGYPATESELRARLEGILTSDEHALLVATDDDRPIGWVHVAVERGLEASGVACLRGLIVDERHRSKGIGRLLIQAAEDWARARGCEVVIVRTRITRERAHRFYRREGFELMKTSHVFGKPLV